MFTLTKDHIEYVKQVCKTAATRHANQAFECVLIECDSTRNEVKLTGGDGIVEIVRVLSADVETDFSTAVNAVKFMQSVDACKSPTGILKDQLIVKHGRRQFKIQTVSAEAYPAYPKSVDDHKIDGVTPSNLIDTIKAVSFAAAKNDVRHMLNGVFIGGHAVATNGHRMCVIDLGLSKNAIVSIEAVNKIPLDISGTVFLSDNVMSIIDESYEFKCKLIDGKYIGYERAIPQSSVNNVSVERADFIDAIKAAQINAPDSGNVIFHFCDESTIRSRSGRNEDAKIGFDCETSADFEMSFNSSYLIDALKVIKSESVELLFTDSQMYFREGGILNVISMCRI